MAELAKSLEQAGHEPEVVAQFMTRCLFCIFAEDVGLLPENSFSELLKSVPPDSEGFKELLEQLFRGRTIVGSATPRRPRHFVKLRERPHCNFACESRFSAMPVVWTIIVGLVVGLIAKLLIPGRDPGGLLIAAALAVAGAFIGYLVGRSLGWYSGEEPAGIIASVFGALLLLTLFRLFVRRNRSEAGRLR